MMYHQTNWQSFQNKVKEDIEKINEEKNLAGNPSNVDKNIIDSKIEEWVAVMRRRLIEETPVKRVDLLPHPRESDLLKLLQRTYERLKGMNWTADMIRQILELQEQMKNESSRLYYEKWDQIIRNLDVDKKDPKKFFDTIRRLLGGKDNGPITYLWGNNRQKIYKDEDKLEQMRET